MMLWGTPKRCTTPDELDRGASWDGADGFHLRPLGELVDGDIEVAVAPGRPRKRAQDVQPPDCEWPRKGYSLQAFCQLMDLLGVELAGLAGLHQLGRVVECRRPVEPTMKRLATRVCDDEWCPQSPPCMSASSSFPCSLEMQRRETSFGRFRYNSPSWMQ